MKENRFSNTISIIANITTILSFVVTVVLSLQQGISDINNQVFLIVLAISIILTFITSRKNYTVHSVIFNTMFYGLIIPTTIILGFIELFHFYNTEVHIIGYLGIIFLYAIIIFSGLGIKSIMEQIEQESLDLIINFEGIFNGEINQIVFLTRSSEYLNVKNFLQKVKIWNDDKKTSNQIKDEIIDVLKKNNHISVFRSENI